MQYVTYQDNARQFHWCLVADDGLKLAVSATAFDSREDARRAAADVHSRAASATRAES